MSQFNIQIDDAYRKKLRELSKRWGLRSQIQVIHKAIDLALNKEPVQKKDLKFWQDYANECRELRKKAGKNCKLMSKEEFYRDVVGF